MLPFVFWSVCRRILRLGNAVFSLYYFVLVARVVIDWIVFFARPVFPPFMVKIIRVLYKLTEPPVRLLRRFIPSLPLGGMYLDLAYLVWWIVVGAGQWLWNMAGSLLFGLLF